MRPSRDETAVHILIAPDSFKGSATAAQAAAAIADGWRSVRPTDIVVTLPLADGGEGSASAIAASTPGSLEIACPATGPDGRPIDASWLLLPDGTAVVELAAASGLPQMRERDALGAQTAGFGQLLADAATHPLVTRIIATVGGSAATDGGTGALRALGARFLDRSGNDLPLGGGSLKGVAGVDVSALADPPAAGVEVLTDVTAPLFGPRGAAAVFGPQKGASAAEVAALDGALRQFAAVVGGNPEQPGAGAAGGAAFGLATLWGATLVPGAQRIGTIVGLPAALTTADLVITGEGSFDDQSTTGKVVGHLLEHSAAQRVWLVAGQITGAVPDRIEQSVALDLLAGSSGAAMSGTAQWLRAAGAQLAGRIT
ncbi:MAG: glycerate kinase [Actinomycetota bacterium]|nr:glycerate kinase [Actinomycetota bacterium]